MLLSSFSASLLSFKAHPCRGSDTIFPGQSLSGNQTIRSYDGGTFELGFFTPGNSRNYYIGIWYGRLPTKTVVWVANRDQPLSDPSSSTLQLSHDERLVLLNQSKTEIWSTDVNSTTPDSTIAVLLDDENLVVLGGTNSSSVVYWQSFDHPTDTWLPGGRIGYSKLTNEKMFLTAWSNPENPAPGIFSSKVEVVQNGTSHDLLWNHSKMYCSNGEWTGKNFVNPNIFGLIFSNLDPILIHSDLAHVNLNLKSMNWTHSSCNPNFVDYESG